MFDPGRIKNNSNTQGATPKPVNAGLKNDTKSLRPDDKTTRSSSGSASDKPLKTPAQQSTFKSPADSGVPTRKASFYDSKGCGSFGLGPGGSCSGSTDRLRPGDVAVPIGSKYKPNEIIGARFCGPIGCSTYSMRVHDMCAGCTKKGVSIDVWGPAMRQRIERDTGYNFSRQGFAPVIIY